MAIAEVMTRLRARRVRGGLADGLKLVHGRRCSGFSSGEYERPVQEALRANLRKGDVFLDVGANIGFFTMLAARIVGDQGRVHAFEPLPANVSVIRQNLQVNGLRNVDVTAKAVADSVGAVTMWVTEHPGGGTLTATGEVPADARKQIEVPQLSLDQWVEEVGPRAVRMIKVDVEGAELAVLRGMQRLAERFRPILLVELDDISRQGLEMKQAVVRDWLVSAGYTVEPMADSYANETYQVSHLLARAGT